LESTNQTVWLTAAQAVVLYLQQQFTERDDQRQRLIAGIFGIFGHGNVVGLGQAIATAGPGLPYYQPRNEGKEHGPLRDQALRRHRATPGDDGRLTHAQVIPVVTQSGEARVGDTVVAAARWSVEDLHKLWDASGRRRAHLEVRQFVDGATDAAGHAGIKMARRRKSLSWWARRLPDEPDRLVTALQEGLKITVIVSKAPASGRFRRLQMLRVGTYGPAMGSAPAIRRGGSPGRTCGAHQPRTAEDSGARSVCKDVG
jgi:TPP-dependent trihydroxycyclohexane-1,2-dione (THcHDO) dehydratase